MLTHVDMEKSQKYSCVVCNYNTSRKTNYEKHLATLKHKMLTHVDTDIDTNDIFVSTKNSNIFECSDCHYKSCKKQNYDKHLLTKKHILVTNATKVSENSTKVSKNATKVSKKVSISYNKLKNNEEQYHCHCGKVYKYRQSLSFHKKKCNQIVNVDDVNFKNIINNDTNNINNELITKIIEQNDSLKNTIVEQNGLIQHLMIEQTKMVNNMVTSKCLGNQTIHTNSHNKINYNINLFLNENCKNAINMSDFIKNLQVGIEDLQLTGKKGIVEGISNLLIKNLNKLPVPDRPIWCSDKKRKSIFIKEDKWEEDENNHKTKEAISNISNVQTKNINKFIEDNPNWIHNDKQKDTYISIVKHSTDDIKDKKEKILEKIIDDIHLTNDKLEKIGK